MEKEKLQRYLEKNKILENVMEKDGTSCVDSEANDVVDLSVDKLINVDEEVKVSTKSLRSLVFCKKMKILLPHCSLLKERMNN